jgi:uncharacterized protein YycO
MAEPLAHINSEKNAMRQNISIRTISVILFLSIFLSCSNDNFESKLKSGDIIFQTSKSQQSKAIQLATHSKYSHVGIVYVENDKILVYEAVQPVKLTPLHEWINRGEKKHFVVKRLKESEKYLISSNLMKMKSIGEKYIGKNYDIYFEWSDERIYCSELVWKIYKEAIGIEIGKLQTLKEFDLENEIVKEIMAKRYETIPMNEKVISPSEMFESDKLVTIVEK